MAFVKLRFGDLFSEPADLIVLPCTTGGTVSQFVSDHLQAFHIPKPRYGMQLGEVDIKPFKGADNIAQFVGFAASVEGMMGYSSLDAIMEAGKTLGLAATSSQAIRNLSTPILGVGFGGLEGESALKALSSGFKETATEDSVLSIFTLDRDLFTSLQDNFASEHSKAKRSSSIRGRNNNVILEDTPKRVF